MSRNKTAGLPQDRAWVTAAEWCDEDPYEHRQIPATRERVPRPRS